MSFPSLLYHITRRIFDTILSYIRQSLQHCLLVDLAKLAYTIKRSTQTLRNLTTLAPFLKIFFRSLRFVCTIPATATWSGIALASAQLGSVTIDFFVVD